MFAYQDIPIDRFLSTSNNFIIDQGVTVFALVLFAMVIFGMMVIMFMMLRNQSRETKQQDKLITQHGLSIAKISYNSIQVNDLREVLVDFIRVATQQDQEKKEVIKTGLETITENTDIVGKNTESVSTMNGKLEDVEKAVRDMQAEIKTFSANMATVLERLDELKSEAETPTEKIHVTQPHTGTGSLGKVDSGLPADVRIKLSDTPAINLTPKTRSEEEV